MRKAFAFVCICLAACQQGNVSDASQSGATGDSIRPVPSVTDNSAVLSQGFTALMQRKKQEGVDFFGIGQEPGWSLEMDTDSVFRFNSIDGRNFNTPPIQGKIIGDSTVYSLSVEMGEMIIKIYEGGCEDIMSGQKFTHSVSVLVKGGLEKEFKKYEGCGAFIK